jgi:hypothetical protein
MTKTIPTEQFTENEPSQQVVESHNSGKWDLINRDPKDPNHLESDGAVPPDDGKQYQYILDTAHPGEDPLYNAVKRTLGLSESEALNNREYLEEITVAIATHLQTDSHEVINKELLKILRKIPFNGNPTSRLYNLRRHLNQLVNEGRRK